MLQRSRVPKVWRISSTLTVVVPEGHVKFGPSRVLEIAVGWLRGPLRDGRGRGVLSRGVRRWLSASTVCEESECHMGLCAICSPTNFGGGWVALGSCRLSSWLPRLGAWATEIGDLCLWLVRESWAPECAVQVAVSGCLPCPDLCSGCEHPWPLL